jgi:hypothetical protein
MWSRSRDSLKAGQASHRSLHNTCYRTLHILHFSCVSPSQMLRETGTVVASTIFGWNKVPATRLAMAISSLWL